MASATAAALDAADGVMDGRHFGRPIVQAPTTFGAQFAQAPVAYPQFGTQFGTQFVGTQFAPQFAPQFANFAAPQTFVGGASSTAAALDAADGVIDGKHFGRPIVQAGAPQVFSAQPAFGQFGSQFGSFVGAPQFASTGFVQPAFGTTFAAPQFANPGLVVAGGANAALAADAADGVIDGKNFGRQIVNTGAPVGGLVPYTGVQQAVFAQPTTFAAAPAFNYGGAIPAATYFGGQRFGGYGAPVASYGGYPAVASYGAPVANYGFPQQFAAVGPQSAQARAAQLDAADGVIDGKFYGRQIVAQRR